MLLRHDGIQQKAAGFKRDRKPIIFHVEAAGQFRPVELTFATELEVRRVRAWRKMTPATDAAEFAALAAKRWLYYGNDLGRGHRHFRAILREGAGDPSGEGFIHNPARHDA